MIHTIFPMYLYSFNSQHPRLFVFVIVCSCVVPGPPSGVIDSDLVADDEKVFCFAVSRAIKVLLKSLPGGAGKIAILN